MQASLAKWFRPNIGRTEQYVRVVVGALLIGLAIIVPTSWGWLGIYPLLTGLMGSSPIYQLLGVERKQKP